MSEPWILHIYEKQKQVYSNEIVGPLELGRRQGWEGAPFALLQGPQGARLIIAERDVDTVSRRHVQIEPQPGGQMRLTNVSQKAGVLLSDGQVLHPGDSCERPLPQSLTLGTLMVQILATADTRSQAPEEELLSLPRATSLPFSGEEMADGLATMGLGTGAVLQGEKVLEWFQAILRVLQSAAASSDFFGRAAQAVVETVGLDLGRVLLREGEAWKPAAIFPAPPAGEQPRPPSDRVLRQVAEARRTFRHAARPGQEDSPSLAGVLAVVAAPILDRNGSVLGALYGERRRAPSVLGPRTISELDATKVELLAGAVAAGLARLERERLQVQFEQFFTPELAHHLAKHPTMLDGQNVEITMLFCDIRGFSGISERIGPVKTVGWIRAVMEALSECVLSERGVLVDYIGDELIAMWGAPEPQADQAERAARAALAMLARLPALNAAWEAELGQPMAVGIGINTGVAQVGNIGTGRKFKYGPLGNSVNLASRVQGATKYLKAPVLVTGATRDRLGPEFAVRRLGKVRVVNIRDAVELFELAPPGRPGWDEICSGYEEGLHAFETQEFAHSAGILGHLVTTHSDGPSLMLLSRAVNCLAEEPTEAFDPCLRLTGK
jgi:adenylate cyclase